LLSRPAGDTLWELKPTAVPTPVLASAARATASYRSKEECTRYFDAGNRFMILLLQSCAPDSASEDGSAIVFLNADGSNSGDPIGWPPFDTFAVDSRGMK